MDREVSKEIKINSNDIKSFKDGGKHNAILVLKFKI